MTASSAYSSPYSSQQLVPLFSEAELRDLPREKTRRRPGPRVRCRRASCGAPYRDHVLSNCPNGAGSFVRQDFKIYDPWIRFFAKTARLEHGPVICGVRCLVWLGTTLEGYGITKIQSRNVRLPRWSYETFIGAFPSHLEVCHKCDNPSCVEPAHLFLGTQAENMRDMIAKGRKAPSKPPVLRGESSHQAKVTTATVALMRSRFASGDASRAQLARDAGISESQVGRILRGENWSHGPSGIAERAGGKRR